MSESQVFAHVLKLSGPAEQAAYLDVACAGDSRLRANVELLLQAHASDPAFLEQPAGSLGETIDEPPFSPQGPSRKLHDKEQPGTLLAGRYQLLEEIGVGGMGSVWKAQQLEPVERLVAVKLIKPGMDSWHMLARFETERQTLALMDHPNVARVLDAGSTEGGRPYFVMELVEGLPITRFCDEQRRTLRQRLELFVAVCQAIQHAHQKGIIHRDVKPSNVLVALIDGKPVAKVIDFGIAKAAGPQMTEQSLFSDGGAIVGTLEYMSPEQAELNQPDIDTRSDVYSLGVLLYELLTGTPPLEEKRLKEIGLLKVLRLIREEEPVKPSTRLSSAEQLPTVAAHRGLQPRKLTRLVRGELDLIVMKALQKDRNRRYESPSALAADVERYLNDEPVLACPPSVGYRLSKLVRRNKRPVLAVVVFVLLLVAGIVGALLGLFRAQITEQEAAREHTEASSFQVQQAWVEAKAQQQTLRSAQETAKAQRQAQQALNALTHEVVAELAGRQTLATDQQRHLLKKVLAYHEAMAATGAENLEGRESQAEACLCVALIHHHLGEVKAAEASYRKAILLRERLAAAFPARPQLQHELALCYNHLGSLLQMSGRLAEAEAAQRKAIALQQRLVESFPNLPDHRRDLAHAHNSLGHLLGSTGRRQEAEAAFRAALATRKQLVADFPRDPDYRSALAGTLAELAALHEKQQDFTAALPLFEQARLSYQAALRASPQKPSYRRAYHSSLQALARCYLDRGDHDRLATTADELARFGYDPAADTVAAARFLSSCLSLVDRDAHLTPARRKELAQRYTERALALVGQAAQHGYTDAAHLKQDPALEPLRAREEFRKLLAELERKTKE